MNQSGLLDFFKRYDFSFFGVASAIFLLGVINLYSATHAATSSYLLGIWKMQVLWFSISLLIGIGVSFIHPQNFFRYGYSFYLFILILLVIVLLVGDKGMGAKRWLLLGPIRFQPSEFMKIGIVLFLARWYARRGPDRPLGLKDLAIPFIITFIPFILIVAEPDLGTGLILMLIFLMISFFRQLKWKTILILLIIGLASGTLMYKFGLKDFQRKRIHVFLDPSADRRGSGYNAYQSLIAIGSGQFFGKGFKKSSQASLNYLPENHTDFVFSVFNEEHGFFGSLFLIGLYLILLFRFLWLSQAVTNLSHAIIGVGLMSIFFWHTFINMGMVMGLMPIVGLPLPFMSYGGTSILTFCICCGIATSISNSRNFF